MSYRALIVDDELLSRQVIATFLRDDTSITVVGEAANGSEAVLQTLQLRPDIVFLDVQMPELDGFEVLREVWPYHQPFVVFTTAYDSYALRAFEVSATDYLLKPFNELRFRQAVARVAQQLDQRQGPPAAHPLLAPGAGRLGSYRRRILVKEQKKIFFVPVEDIHYFDSDSNYISVHTATGTHLIYESLTLLEQQLDPTQFTRISRSCLVGLTHVAALETYYNGEYIVNMRNGTSLKWTRTYRDNLQAFYGLAAS